jgi:superfamily I DNA/RNA helicase
MNKKNFFIDSELLDDFQRQLINSTTNKSMIVEGCAGSGKSVLALYKAKEIKDKQLGTCLYIVYTRALMQYMSDGIKQLDLQANVNYYWNWEHSNMPKADYILIDEVTDFSKEEFENIKSKANKYIICYGDSNQQLYEFKSTLAEGEPPLSINDVVGLTNWHKENLIFNHRLPRKIAPLAQYFNTEGDNLINRCIKNPYGETPKILKYVNWESQIKDIARIIKQKQLTDVGIFFRHNDEVKRAYEYMKDELQMTVEAKFSIKINGSSSTTMNLNFNSDNPKLMTCHSSKGLQFETVFIPECVLEANEEEKKVLYVAITRTYNSLYIMHSGNLSTLFDDVPQNLYETKLVLNTIEDI